MSRMGDPVTHMDGLYVRTDIELGARECPALRKQPGRDRNRVEGIPVMKSVPDATAQTVGDR